MLHFKIIFTGKVKQKPQENIAKQEKIREIKLPRYSKEPPIIGAIAKCQLYMDDNHCWKRLSGKMNQEYCEI